MGAKLLLIATLLALLCSNSPLYPFYTHILQTPFYASTNLSLLVNDGLMTLFFFIVSIEIKYELCQGALNTLPKAILPCFAALGGMVVPALLYISLTYYDPLLLRGWAIPTATDIAFALAVLALLGPLIPASLKIFLVSLAIVDDLAAILIIAFFYTEHVSILFLLLAGALVLLLIVLNLKKIPYPILYLPIGIGLWFFLLKSGIHPTLAGVLLAFLMPLHLPNTPFSLQKLKDFFHPFVALIILPLFAFANAGVAFSLVGHSLNLHLIWGIILGLFLGKQCGIFLASWCAVRMKWAQLPEDTTWAKLYGAAITGGIGFTISLFISNLAFYPDHQAYLNSAKIGVLAASLLSGTLGYFGLKYLCKQKI